MPIAERTLALPRGDFRCLTAGADHAPLVLCLHGFPDIAPTFVSLLEALASRGYFAVAPWMRGYAPSTLDGPFHAQALGADAIAMADALSPGRAAALVGHDWGAVATYMALAGERRRFACAVTMAVPHPFALGANLAKEPAQLRRSWYMGFFQLPVVPERLVPRGDFAFIDRLWRTWSPGFVAPDAHMRALKQCLAASMPAPIDYYRAIARPLVPTIQRTRVFARTGGRIDASLLCLMGAGDGCIAPSMGHGQERFFTGRFRADVVPDAGHFLHLERAGDVNARILAWLAAELPTASRRQSAKS